MAAGLIGRRILALIAVATLGVSGLFASPAFAAQNPPPGWTDPAGEWVGFSIDNTSPAANGRAGGHQPVTVTRTSSSSVQVSWFNNWEALNLDASDPAPDAWRWPTSLEHPGGAHLSRIDACDYTQTTCRYAVTSDGEFWLFGGTPPTDPGSGLPNPNPATFQQHVARDPIPTINIGALNAVGTAGVGGAAGTIHLTAAGTIDEAELGPLTYKWVLVGPRSKIYTSEGTADFFDVTAEMDGVYCVELTVTASDGHFVETPECAGGTGSTFSITGVAPAKTEAPAPTPGGGGTGGGGTGGGGTGGGATGGGGGIPGIGFSNPSARAPSTLTGGTPGASPTVIWLWRPEWFQDTPQTNELPRTDGQPKVTGRADIVVRRPTPKGASAGPWLAGVGIFGLMGGGWVLSRHRRLRMLAEL